MSERGKNNFSTPRKKSAEGRGSSAVTSCCAWFLFVTENCHNNWRRFCAGTKLKHHVCKSKQFIVILYKSPRILPMSRLYKRYL